MMPRKIKSRIAESEKVGGVPKGSLSFACCVPTGSIIAMSETREPSPPKRQRMLPVKALRKFIGCYLTIKLSDGAERRSLKRMVGLFHFVFGSRTLVTTKKL